MNQPRHLEHPSTSYRDELCKIADRVTAELFEIVERRTLEALERVEAAKNPLRHGLEARWKVVDTYHGIDYVDEYDEAQKAGNAV